MNTKQACDQQIWECSLCLHRYDPATGDPEHGIPPGTLFENLPDDWHCPGCGMDKHFYVVLAV